MLNKNRLLSEQVNKDADCSGEQDEVYDLDNRYIDSHTFGNCLLASVYVESWS